VAATAYSGRVPKFKQIDLAGRDSDSRLAPVNLVEPCPGAVEVVWTKSREIRPLSVRQYLQASVFLSPIPGPTSILCAYTSTLPASRNTAISGLPA